MRNPEILSMRSGVIDTNKYPDTQPLTDATALDSFMDLSVLI